MSLTDMTRIAGVQPFDSHPQQGDVPTQQVYAQQPSNYVPSQPVNTPQPQKKDLRTLWIILAALFIGMILTMLGIWAYWSFSKPQGEVVLSDTTVLVTDTVYQTTPPAQPTAPASPAMTLRNGGQYNYSGTIAGQRVSVMLNNAGGSVSGSYRYTKFTNDNQLMLTGTLNGSNLELYEVNEVGNYTGYISATLTANGISGKFTNMGSGKRYNVNLIQE